MRFWYIYMYVQSDTTTAGLMGLEPVTYFKGWLDATCFKGWRMHYQLHEPSGQLSWESCYRT